MSNYNAALLQHIDIVPDFPEPGINFYDIQSLLKKPDVWADIMDDIAQRVKDSNADIIIGLEARGFLIGTPVAERLNMPFGMVRKPGKLPGEVVSQTYQKEYGPPDEIQIQADLIQPGMRVAIVDDLMATGGTLKAAEDLVTKLGGEVVKSIVVLDLAELDGKAKLNHPFEAVSEAPLDPKNIPEIGIDNAPTSLSC